MWNYRIIENAGYAVHEVYYDDEGNPTSWTANSVGIIGDTFDEICRDLKLYAKAFEKPVLTLVDGKLMEL